MNKLIGVILAGGKSVRMGQDKSQLPINGETMLAHMLSILSQSQLVKVIINSNILHACDSTEDDNESRVEQYFKDIIPHKGPLSGIHSALVNFPDADLLIVPVDMPMITAKSLNTLILNAQMHKVNSRFTAISTNSKKPTYKTTTMPLYIHNTRETRQKLEHTLLNSNTLSVYHFCSHFPILEVLLDDELELTNLNYPEQLSQFNKA